MPRLSLSLSSLVLLLGAVSSCNALLVESAKQLPRLNFDYVIIGGTAPLDSKEMLLTMSS